MPPQPINVPAAPAFTPPAASTTVPDEPSQLENNSNTGQVNIDSDGVLSQTSSEEAATVNDQINSFIATTDATQEEVSVAAPDDFQSGPAELSAETTASATQSSPELAQPPQAQANPPVFEPATEEISVAEAPPELPEPTAQLADAVNDMVQSAPPPPDAAVNGKKLTIQPINDPANRRPDINALMAEEEAKGQPIQPPATRVLPPSSTTPNSPPQPGTTIDPNSIAL